MSSGRTSEDRARTRVGAWLKGRWHLDALLGIGGTAAVYLATHRNGNRAAIESIHSELLTNDDLLARFVREGVVTNRVDHPGVPAVLDDDWTDDGSFFLVLELLEGSTLSAYSRPKNLLPYRRVLEYIDETLDVLVAAHRKGVIHRDIKPANLFLTTDGQIKVLDFGIARLAEGRTDATATQTGTGLGTPAYMPPEQARGRWNLIDARTDVWAVGATLFALLTGRRVRMAETMQEDMLLAMTAPAPSVALYNRDLPAPIVTLVDRALAYDMSARWPSASAMQEALRAALADAPSDAPVSTAIMTGEPRDAPEVMLGLAPLQSERALTLTGQEGPASKTDVAASLTNADPVERPSTVRTRRSYGGTKLVALVAAALLATGIIKHPQLLDRWRTPAPLQTPASSPAATETSSHDTPAPLETTEVASTPIVAPTKKAVPSASPPVASTNKAETPPRPLPRPTASPPPRPRAAPAPAASPEPGPDAKFFDRRF